MFFLFDVASKINAFFLSKMENGSAWEIGREISFYLDNFINSPMYGIPFQPLNCGTSFVDITRRGKKK